MRSQLRAQQALELWVYERRSYREIAAELGISRSQAGALVRGALQRSQREHDDTAHLGLQLTLETLNMVQREGHEVLTRVCPSCHGHGTRNSKPCKRCTGTGLWYEPAERRRWAALLLREVDQRSKLLGEYAPTDHRLVDEHGEAVSVREILVAMSPEEVAREAGFYLAGHSDGAAAAAAEATDEGAAPGAQPEPGSTARQ